MGLKLIMQKIIKEQLQGRSEANDKLATKLMKQQLSAEAIINGNFKDNKTKNYRSRVQ